MSCCRECACGDYAGASRNRSALVLSLCPAFSACARPPTPLCACILIHSLCTSHTHTHARAAHTPDLPALACLCVHLPLDLCAQLLHFEPRISFENPHKPLHRRTKIPSLATPCTPHTPTPTPNTPDLPALACLCVDLPLDLCAQLLHLEPRPRHLRGVVPFAEPRAGRDEVAKQLVVHVVVVKDLGVVVVRVRTLRVVRSRMNVLCAWACVCMCGWGGVEAHVYCEGVYVCVSFPFPEPRARRNEVAQQLVVHIDVVKDLGVVVVRVRTLRSTQPRRYLVRVRLCVLRR